MVESIREQRRVGDVRKYKMQAGPSFGPHGAVMALAYWMGARGKIQPIVPFELKQGIPDLMADKQKNRLKAITDVVHQAPQELPTNRLVGLVAVTTLLLDPEDDLRREPALPRFRYLGGVLLHAEGAEPESIAPPDPRQFTASGIGLVAPEGARTLSHAVMMPHVSYGDAVGGVRLTSMPNPAYGVIHASFPEILVERDAALRAAA